MQVSVTSNEGLERSMTVEVPADQVKQEIQQRLKSMAGSVRLDGFRPGKVPFKVLEKRYGPRIRQEVESELMQRSFYEAIQKENLRPAGMPRLELAGGGEKLEFTATFEVYPDVKVEIPADLVVEKIVADITDSDIDNMVEKLRKQRSTWEEVERAAQNDDQVTIDFVGKIDGVPFEGGEAKGFQLILGSGRFIPGFEDQLVGKKAGDNVEVNVTFPENYQSEDLSGRPAVFEVTVHSVSAPNLPAVDDEDFLEALGAKEGGIDAVRKDVRESMARELSQRLEGQTKERVLDKVLNANPIELPGALVESEIQQMANQARQSMGMQGEQPVTDQVREALGERARRRVGLGLLVGELISQQGFKADADKVRARIEDIASSYEDSAAVINWYYEDKSRLSGVEALVLEDQVVGWIMDQAKIEEVKKPFEEVMQDS